MGNKLGKVILLFIEGESDELALQPLLNGIVKKASLLNVRVEPCSVNTVEYKNGDVTSKIYSSRERGVVAFVGDVVKKHIEYLNRTLKINKNNVIGVIHIIDTDGTYLDKNYAYDDGGHDFLYREDGIHADSKERIIKRNESKAAAMDKLSNVNTILGLPYKAYYMSCNLDHVINNERNESDAQGVKTDAAIDFSDRYENDLVIFWR